MRTRNVTAVLIAISVIVCTFSVGGRQVDKLTPLQERERASKLYQQGNYKDALEIFRKLALDPEDNPVQVPNDMNMALTCLQQINRAQEKDALREKIIGIHKDNWRLLKAAATNYFRENHYGYIIAGEFKRGHHRGGGRYVNSFERDRVRALQLMDRARLAAKGKATGWEQSYLHLEFARILMGYRGYSGAWRMQYLTDLAELPDYDEGYGYAYGRTRGAPVNPDGTPVYHYVPESYETAVSDGQRWRWMLVTAVELEKGQTGAVMNDYANFLRQQFGVQTMAYYSGWLRAGDDDNEDESGTYALHTLSDGETIARLATGVKRLELPEEFNFISLYRKLAEDSESGYAEVAVNMLATIFEDRRLYNKAVSLWRRSIREHGPGHENYKQKKIDQIIENWGQFEPIMTHPAGEEASVEFRFRNGRRVALEAREINVSMVLADVKSYLKSNPRKLDWQRMNLANIGYRIIEKNQKKYLGRTAAEWSVELQPRPMHFDRRITIKTPLTKAGAYLLTARMEDGNTSNVVIWLADTVIVRKPLDKRAYFFVADAVTGEPLPGINVEFFGYRQEYIKRKIPVVGRRYNVLTTAFAEFTDERGQVMPEPKDLPNNYQWLISATTDEGRLAYMGFSGIWYPRRYDHEYNQRKVYVITDRPVYRPNHTVKFKFWVRHAKYDQENISTYANQSFTIRINNPKGEKVLEESFTADEYGGFDGVFVLPDDATLGVYSIHIPHMGGGSFRVEEYKKPEFEVKIEAPSEPVTLGEKITVTVRAKYYFGAPVVKAKVKYKVLRSDYSSNWYPVGLWDWFYGPGYWWFAYDYRWYPGWREWGCKRPHWWWWPSSRTPPEVIAEAEVEIGADGTVEIVIDTAMAKEMHGDTDHRYEITAEVTDESRRTIVGVGKVLVARKPFKVYAWVDRGHYRVGDVVSSHYLAQTLDSKPVTGKGALTLYRISYKDGKPIETAQQKWNLDTDSEGRAQTQIKATRAGQYRLSYSVTDGAEHTIEGGYVFTVMGQGTDGKQFRFNEIELVPEKREYAAGEKVRLMINTDQADATVVLFVRPTNGVYLPPKVIKMTGKSVIQHILVTKKDMPNFFIEAFTISGGKVYSETREIIVPPEKRVLNVEVLPSANRYKPGEAASVKIRMTDFAGNPFAGSLVMAVYDRSVEYISGGSNVPAIREFFWKWRRRHNPNIISSLDRYFRNLIIPGQLGMGSLGAFGHLIADQFGEDFDDENVMGVGGGRRERYGRRSGGGMKRMVMKSKSGAMDMAGPASMMLAEAEGKEEAGRADFSGGQAGSETVQPTVRTKFADTAFWAASLTTNRDGIAEVTFDMPENLSGWKLRTWGMGHGTVVGEGTAEVVTAKDLMLRLQAPRFFVEKDEVVLSANVHNYLETAKDVSAVLELDGGCLELMDAGAKTQTIKVDSNGEKRVDWRVKVVAEGEAVIRMKALTDEESDAMEMRFPVYVHGMLKTDSFSGMIRLEDATSSFEITVPIERRIEQSRLEVRYTPTLAGAMVDALPYLVEYPYGCTEQTLNRFLPTVITQKILKDMGLDLADIRDKRTNLNAQEIGDDVQRMADWKRLAGTKRWNGTDWVPRNPVFDEKKVADMVKQGLKRLTAMQLSDGGWGWFSGWGEYSYPHTTAYVVHGLQIAQSNGVAIVPGVLQRGIGWLTDYQAREVRKLNNWPDKIDPRKHYADNIDAFVFMVLADADEEDGDMLEFLYRDRNKLAVYGKAMYGMALHKRGHKQKLDMILRNIEQFLVRDPENQTAYLNLQNGGYWWYWYGSEYEAQAYYLKLLAATNPGSEDAAGLVKYLLNNRRHATYWNSTRDTALCIEALADYLRASGEGSPDMTVEIFLDGEKKKEVRITAENIFSFDNKLVITGGGVTSGKHTIEIRRKGKGPVYFNAYLTNFTLEDYITRAGLEIKVNRKYYRLKRVAKTINVSGARGQALDQKIEKYVRKELANLATLKSGDLVEIELEIESKNDYEYIVFEDMKAAGFEPVSVRSGYNGNDLGAYMELRDEKVCLFVRSLARGRHSVSYRVRAEIPGRFSALPTRAYAMYAPELRANSDEIKLVITD